MLSWQNILNSRQIAADIEEKLANQGEVLRRGISCIYLSWSSKWRPCHGAIKNWTRNPIKALEKYFRFCWNCKQLWVEGRNSMSNCQIYFPIFSDITHTILKTFSQCGLRTQHNQNRKFIHKKLFMRIVVRYKFWL